ncbi:MAG: hypothetical protein SGCHY_002155 [Lobulomycetales sp.]
MCDRPLICGPETPPDPFPVKLKGNVQKGYGRGSKELGIPTANLPEEVAAGASLETGIYYGLASVGPDSRVHPMVMSYGWNPFYKNKVRSAEVHIMHSFDEDFYGQELRVIVLGYIRAEKNYESVEALIADINFDIRVAHASLERVAYRAFSSDGFLLPLQI